MTEPRLSVPDFVSQLWKNRIPCDSIEDMATRSLYILRQLLGIIVLSTFAKCDSTPTQGILVPIAVPMVPKRMNTLNHRADSLTPRQYIV